MAWWSRIFGAQKDAPPTAPLRSRVEPPKDAKTYFAVLTEVLDSTNAQARAKIDAAIANLPENTRAMDFGVHPSQDPDGVFSVMIHLDGPDLYVLNKAIAPHREVFDRHHGPDGGELPLPYFDPEEVDYDINAVIADASFDWVERLWQDTGKGHTELPVSVFFADDFGDVQPRILNTAPVS